MGKRILFLSAVVFFFLSMILAAVPSRCQASNLVARPEEEKHTTWKDVNYMDLFWGEGYAVPYHLKRFNVYDLFVDWGGSTAGLFRWDHEADKNAQIKDQPGDIQRWLMYFYFNVRYQDWLRYYVKFRNIYHGNDYAPYDNKNEGIDVDQMYWEVMFEPFNLTTGRQWQKLGRGHVYRNNFDAIKLIYSDDFVDVDVYMGKVLGDNQDAFTYNNHQRKYPIGATATYKEFMKHLFQGYIVGVVDHTDDQLYYRDSRYQPVYFGSYAVGRFDINKYKVRNLNYYAETVKTYGRSNVSDFSAPAYRYDTETIDTFLLDFGAVIQIDHPWKPEIENEFAWGSGDKDVPLYGTIVMSEPSSSVIETANVVQNYTGTDTIYLNQRGAVNSTVRGNPKGSRDTMWRGIDGYVNYGVALNPILSNLMVYKFGIKFNPIKRLTVELNSYAYWKQYAQAPISDFAADVDGRYVGNEFDLLLDYDLTRYSRISLAYGHFFCGSVYPTNAHTDEDLIQLVYQYVF